MTAPANQRGLRALPSVDRALRELSDIDLPRPIVLRIVRRELDTIRAEMSDAAAPPDGPQVVARLRAALDGVRQSRLRPVINGTGVVIHTNFGRSPLAQPAVDAVAQIAASYGNLEFDLSTGERGRRATYVEQALATACDAEDAAVVNNCAAALVLILHGYAAGERREVIISRGELVQIGGGFRVPEILESTGAILREVGTTNRTTLADYESALGDRTAMILKVHRSNFYMDGFVASPPTDELAALARARGVLFVEDLGSGALCATEELLHGGEHEPTPAEVLWQGADLVTFSGDKLLGGPQAGVIAGAAKHVAALRRNPLFRALRCDKLVLGAMQATLDLHLSDRTIKIPIIAMMRQSIPELRERAQKLGTRLADSAVHAVVAEATSQIGGGSLPRTVLPSIVIELQPKQGSIDALAAALRNGEPPVVGYIHAGKLRLDLRAIFPEQDEPLAGAILRAGSSAEGAGA